MWGSYAISPTRHCNYLRILHLRTQHQWTPNGLIQTYQLTDTKHKSLEYAYRRRVCRLSRQEARSLSNMGTMRSTARWPQCPISNIRNLRESQNSMAGLQAKGRPNASAASTTHLRSSASVQTSPSSNELPNIDIL